MSACSDLLVCLCMHALTSDYFYARHSCSCTLMCICPLCIRCISGGSTVKSQTEDNYETYLCHTASGRAIPLLVYLLRHTPSHWGSVTPPPPPPPHSC